MNSGSQYYPHANMSNIGAAPPFPRVRPSSDHTVLYLTNAKQSLDEPPQPYKTYGGERWDNYHVRMPHSQHNQYEKSGWTLKSTTESRWDIIEKALGKEIHSSNDLTQAILKYNAKFKDVWKFQALHCYLNKHLNKKEKKDFFKKILPEIIKLALQLPELIQAPLPLLRQNENKSLSLSQLQIASLLANAFLCTFPWRNTSYQKTSYAKLPKINFISLYEGTDESVFQKLRCICNYFKRVISKPPTGVVTFSRRCVPMYDCPPWEYSTDHISSVPVVVNSDLNIEDADGLIQVDFANKFLGGGVLGSGLVQEEIRFLICPELMASMIFTESLTSQEALMIIGCERYNDYTGYGRETFQWAGDHHDNMPFDSSRRRCCAVLAIDAVQYWDPNDQFRRNNILRELNKAWIGFTFYANNSKSIQYPAVATGNWGCGAFNGTPQLKCLIQMMAAAAAKRLLLYCTFGDQQHANEVETVYDHCRKHGVTVGELFKCLKEYDYTKADLHSFLIKKLEDKLEKYRSADTSEDQTNKSEERHVQRKNIDSQIAGPYTRDNYRQYYDTQRETTHQRNNQQNASQNTSHESDLFTDRFVGYCTGESSKNCGPHSQNYPKGHRRGSDHSQRERKNCGPSQHQRHDNQQPRSDSDHVDSQIEGSSTSDDYGQYDTTREIYHQRNNQHSASQNTSHEPQQNFAEELMDLSQNKNKTTDLGYYNGESSINCGQHSQNYPERHGRGSDHSQRVRKNSGPPQNKRHDDKQPRSDCDHFDSQIAGSSTSYDYRQYDTPRETCQGYNQHNASQNTSHESQQNFTEQSDTPSQNKKKMYDPTNSNFTGEPSKNCGQNSRNYPIGHGWASDHSQRGPKNNGPSHQNRYDNQQSKSDYGDRSGSSHTQCPPILKDTAIITIKKPPMSYSDALRGSKRNDSSQIYQILGNEPPLTRTAPDGRQDVRSRKSTTIEFLMGSFSATVQAIKGKCVSKDVQGQKKK